MGFRKGQSGQSMTEFVVSAAFVMVPLFLIVPVVGKYIDMKLATVQAARYAAWEYSAHYVDLDDQPGGFDKVKAIARAELPTKSLRQVQREALRYYYSDTSIPVRTVGGGEPYDDGDANPLWRYHNGDPMFDPGPGPSPVTASGSGATPDKTSIINGILGPLGTVLNIVADILAFAGIEAGFDAINPDGNWTIDGLYTARMAVPVEPAPDYAALQAGNRQPLFLQPLDLTMRAQAGILTETWGAGGPKHSVFQSSGLVPTVILDSLLNDWVPLQDIAATILISPELASDSLQFGYPARGALEDDPKALRVMDQVPMGKLEGQDPDDLECPGGYCENPGQ